MAIQDLINEVNSIQSKKQAIKEAITAKGVNSEGKLSKFADEIKQISTGEPDWFILNRIRHDNGNEGIAIRTNTDEKSYFANLCQVTELGAGTTQDGSIINSTVATDFYIMNGSCFTNKETICRRMLKTSQENNLALDVHNDNIKTLAGSKIYQLLFNDINTYSWLKPFKNNSLVDANAVYLKAEEVNIINSVPVLSGVRDIVSTSMTPMPIMYDSKEYQAVMIDSTLLLTVSRMQPIDKAGFVRIAEDNKKIYPVSLQPYSYSHDFRNFGYIPYMGVNLYESLPMGNYVYVYATRNNTYVVFVGINYIVGDGSKKKNIEVYPYEVLARGSQLGYSYYVADKPVELYINFSQQGQQAIANTPNLAIFRRKVLAANGTPEPNTSKFLNGKDAFICYSCRKNIRNHSVIVQNLFKKDSNKNIDYNKASGTKFKISYPENYSLIHNRLLIDIYGQNSKATGFICIGEDIGYVELQKTTSPASSADISFYGNPIINDFIFLPDGIGLANTENKAMFLAKINNNLTGYAYTIKKSDNTEITTALYPTDKTVPIFLYITTDTDTQNYIKSKPLTDIWTEIQDVYDHKEEYDAYNEY